MKRKPRWPISSQQWQSIAVRLWLREHQVTAQQFRTSCTEARVYRALLSFVQKWFDNQRLIIVWERPQILFTKKENCIQLEAEQRGYADNFMYPPPSSPPKSHAKLWPMKASSGCRKLTLIAGRRTFGPELLFFLTNYFGTVFNDIRSCRIGEEEEEEEKTSLVVKHFKRFVWIKHPEIDTNSAQTKNRFIHAKQKALHRD